MFANAGAGSVNWTAARCLIRLVSTTDLCLAACVTKLPRCSDEDVVVVVTAVVTVCVAGCAISEDDDEGVESGV